MGPAFEYIIETEIHGDVSLYNSQRDHVAVLNTTASDVWRLCDGEQTLDEIVKLLASSYEADPEVIRPDVERTIADLVDGGFLPEI